MTLKVKLKSKPYWIKGGIILDSIYCALFLLGILLSPLSIINSAVKEVVEALILFISVPGIWIITFAPGLSYNEGIGWGFFIGALIAYFLIGAIIGWIYGQIKTPHVNSYKEQ